MLTKYNAYAMIMMLFSLHFTEKEDRLRFFLKAPELGSGRIDPVDEEEEYRAFGGCLPAATHSRMFFHKSAGRPAGQREKHVGRENGSEVLQKISRDKGAGLLPVVLAPL